MMSSISPLPSTPEETVLLTCMRFYFRTTTTCEVTSLLTPYLNWETLVQTAIDHSVMPLFYQSLKAIEGELIPQSVMVQLQTLNRMNGLNNIAQTKELLKILALLESRGIEAIAFKGPILATSVYGNVALRQFNDLDILVPLQDFWQTKAVLVGQGYQSPTSKEIEIDKFNHHLQIPLSYKDPETTMFNQRFQSSLLHSNPERSIDLHWGIPPRRILNPDRLKRLWENLSQIDLMGKQIKTFSPELTLVIQCLNVAKDSHWNVSFKQVCDVAQVIQAYPNLNWHLAWQISSELCSQRLFLIGLGISHDLLHIPLPQFVLEKCARSKLIDWQILGGNFMNLPNYQKYWLLWVIPLKTLNWSWYSLLIIVRYLQFTISPNQKDREFLHLPNGLFFIYYVIRPIRLLIKFLPFRISPLRQNNS
ncbi:MULTISPECIES: nucleotidyltransferase domain-containing protein [unclassified Nostoc]|uniref:nucleotidyltransferase domain-containing protein n=1 Tax=unclassified Nostoc TaxID=2593658 RepID=UPI00261ED29E|nr:nucleotidyltransferase family protein [Nostoc sp. S13]MDF5738736.1 nucleotidyltransferase family protein [Nostoc sp. S13]